MKITRLSILLGILGLTLCAIPFRAPLRRHFVTAIQTVRGQPTVADRVAEFGAAVEARVLPEFVRIGVAYPPSRMTLVGLKTGIDNVSIILSPVDFRVRRLPAPMPLTPEWTERLYQTIRQELAKLGTQQR